jgi:hypothetical protein
MEQLISRINTSPTTIGWKQPLSFTIAINLLTPSTKAADLEISPRTIVAATWNNYENLEDGSFSMKHPKR